MSSEAGNPDNGGPHKQYFCHQCEQHVGIVPPPSPTAELVCPNCHGEFLEESETHHSNPNPNPFSTTNNSTYPGFPLIFTSSSNSPGAAVSFSLSSRPDGGNGDLSAIFHRFINNLRASGQNVQYLGDRGMNLPDYFVGPSLEQLIQQLVENDPNRYGTPPASKSSVEGLPDIKITEEMLASDSSQCAVCKDSFELNEEGKQMPCNHIYHKECIMPWLVLHNSCPVCRYELPTDDPDYENRKTGQMNVNSNGNGGNSNLVLRTGDGSRENRDNNNNYYYPQAPVEMRVGPMLFRGSGSLAETSNIGGSGAGSSDGWNHNSSHSNNGAPNTGSGGWMAGEEDLD
ncbi:hypothetical protein ACJIZ3_021000 [Penstemon smallii]|uniref:RING-type E3 ubiquitin transferase n=1 Tax=Penstemon smallii TaxID=265156 RepID=A0ABD3SKQ4_9LAMI